MVISSIKTKLTGCNISAFALRGRTVSSAHPEGCAQITYPPGQLSYLLQKKSNVEIYQCRYRITLLFVKAEMVLDTHLHLIITHRIL